MTFSYNEYLFREKRKASTDGVTCTNKTLKCFIRTTLQERPLFFTCFLPKKKLKKNPNAKNLFAERNFKRNTENLRQYCENFI